VQGGIKAEINAGLVLRRRLTISGSTLRPRPIAFKAAIAASLKDKVWPLLENGSVKPVIHSVFEALGDSSGSGACKAHNLMESNQHIGKIVLTWSHA
jgi:NADPH2:quinone reductase